MSKKPVLINPDLTYTKSEYSKNFGVARSTIDARIKAKEINFIEVNGTTLIIAERR